MTIFERFFCQKPLRVVCDQQNEIILLRNALSNLSEESLEAKIWNSKWPKNKVIYKAQGEIELDIRNLIYSKSYILEPEIGKLRKETPDLTALAILKYVKRRITYDSDINIYKKAEFWQHPEETFQTKRGDCEDGALLLISLGLMAGIPSYRIKLCAGWVRANNQKAGHAYVIYLAEDGQWYCLDWCFFANDSIRNFKRKSHKEQKNRYQDIWFTANNEHSWSEHTYIYE